MEIDEFESAKRKRRPRLCVSMDKSNYDAIRKYADDNGYDLSKLVERILLKFLDERKK